jgi:hypothetical protein
VFVGAGTFQLWQEGPWDLPKPGKGKEAAPAEEPKEEPSRIQVANTRNIIEKNLFDPERGAGRTKEAEASSIAMQRIRSMVLLGTAILGTSRYAIMQEPTASRSPAGAPQTGSSGQMRLKLGDTVEGFKLSEIREKSVVFTKGASRVEVALDFSRRVVEPGVKAPAQPRPRVAPSSQAPAGKAEHEDRVKPDKEARAEKASKPRRERQLQPPQQPQRPPRQKAQSKVESAPAESPE